MLRRRLSRRLGMERSQQLLFCMGLSPTQEHQSPNLNRRAAYPKELREEKEARKK